MRKFTLTLILFTVTVCAFYIQAQMIEKGDTLYLNYFIAYGEFGGHNEGLKIYIKNCELNAISIKYNNSSISFILKALTDTDKKNKENHITFNSESDLYMNQRDSIFTKALIDFYKNNTHNYTVLKSEWVLNKNQLDYISKILDEIKTRPVEENVFSNASEHYAILTNDESYVFIDRA